MRGRRREFGPKRRNAARPRDRGCCRARESSVKLARKLEGARRHVSVRRDIPSDQSEHLRLRLIAPHLARREAVLTAEAAVEIGEIAEADIVGDGADRGATRAGLA